MRATAQQSGLRAFGRIRKYLAVGSLLLTVAFGVAPASGAFGTERPLAVDDILKLSDVGRAAARPGTDTFVWEQSPPYDRLGDYGIGSTGTWQNGDYWIFTAGPESKAPKKLFQPNPRAAYRLGEFSSDGRFLSLLAMHDGKVILAVYDFERQRLTEFPLAPRFPGYQPSPEWAWLDNHRLAVAAYPAGEAGTWPFTFRRAIGTRLSEAWERSWEGKEPSVDVYDSSSSDTVRPLPGRLVTIDMQSGRIRELASGQFSGLRASPDGRWLAAAKESSLPQHTLQQPHTDWTYAQCALVLFSLSGAPQMREVAPGLDLLPDSMVWKPSGKNLAFFAWHIGATFSSGEFWQLDAPNGVVNIVPHEGLSLASQRARGGAQWPERPVWLGDALAVLARPTPGKAGSFTYEEMRSRGAIDPRVTLASLPAHWFLLGRDPPAIDLTSGLKQVSPVPVIATGSQAIVIGDGQVLQLDASGTPARLFSNSPPLLDVLRNQHFFEQTRLNGGGGFFPVAGDPGTLAKIDLEEGAPVLKLLTAPLESRALALSGSGTVLLQMGAGKGAKLALLRSGGKPESLGKLNPFLDSVAETRWVDFPYSNAQGATRSPLSGCLLLPADYHRGYKYPLVVEIYPDRSGGCAGAENRNEFAMAVAPAAYSEHLLAAKGFVVLRPDAGGGISRTADGPQAGLPAVVDRAIDAVIAAGYVDPDRVGLMGYSQGGFASLWLATQSPRYKAVVSINGYSDLMTAFFDMDLAQEFVPTEIAPQGHPDRYLISVGSPFSMGGTPWQFPERYIRNSPLWRSDSVTAPALLIHSDLDNFNSTSYKQFFSSLFMQKKDARLLIYRGEGHAPSSPANIRDMWKNIFYWLDRYLNVKRDSDGSIILE
jgi:dienelactone hydrolase